MVSFLRLSIFDPPCSSFRTIAVRLEAEGKQITWSSQVIVDSDTLFWVPSFNEVICN